MGDPQRTREFDFNMANQGGSSCRLRYRGVIDASQLRSFAKKTKDGPGPVGFLRWRPSMTVRRAPRRRKSAASGVRLPRVRPESPSGDFIKDCLTPPLLHSHFVLLRYSTLPLELVPIEFKNKEPKG